MNELFPTPMPTPAPAGPLFLLGQVFLTDSICDSGLTSAQLGDLIRRHQRGSWDMDADDIAANMAALTSGARIFGAFDVPQVDGGKVWMITEADDRAHTCILLPADY